MRLLERELLNMATFAGEMFSALVHAETLVKRLNPRVPVIDALQPGLLA